MSQNPLQKYFRQPKIFVKLPSNGVYNKIGSLTGDVSNMPVFGMTGMDELLMKTPDALLSGESIVKVIESCCPNIKDAWEITSLDTDLILSAIRIATFGNKLTVTQKCRSCGEENDYDIELSTLIDHFSSFIYDNKIVINDLTIKLQPLTYRQSTEFSLRNFELQQQLSHYNNDNKDEQQKLIASLFKQLGILQNELIYASIESVQTSDVVVTDRSFILEWINNCDKEVFDIIKEKFNKNREALQIPPYKVKCGECDAEGEIMIDLDQSSFFAKA